MKVTLEGAINDDELAVRVANELGIYLRDKWEYAFRERVEDELATYVKSLTDERLTSEVDRLLTGGWPKTNSYGEPTGQKDTLSSLVRDRLTKKDTYGDKTQIEKAVDESVKKLLEKECGELIAQLKARVRGAIDAKLADKLRTAVDEAIR